MQIALTFTVTIKSYTVAPEKLLEAAGQIRKAVKEAVESALPKEADLAEIEVS